MVEIKFSGENLKEILAEIRALFEAEELKEKKESPKVAMPTVETRQVVKEDVVLKDNQTTAPVNSAKESTEKALTIEEVRDYYLAIHSKLDKASQVELYGKMKAVLNTFGVNKLTELHDPHGLQQLKSMIDMYA